MPATTPPNADHRFSVDELESLSHTPRRTIRYYIQLGLVDRPIGETRAAHYTWKHLGQLLRIRELTESGLSLEAVGQRLKASATDEPPPAAPASGSVVVQSHIHIAAGIELVVDPSRARLSAHRLRQLIRQIADLAEQARNASEHPDDER